MLSVQTFKFNPFEENTYVVADETGEAVIIDPGCYTREEQQELIDYIDEKKLTIKLIISTHSHIDHVLGNDFVKDKYKAPLLVHQLDEPQLRAVKNYAPLYGFHNYREALPDQLITENDLIKFGNSTLKILFLPGHAPGHVGYYNEEEKKIFAGDVLFASSIGRTDLPGGNFETLIQSIHKKLFTLPDDIVVYPGHGPTTTIGVEKISNPFCALSLIR